MYVKFEMQFRSLSQEPWASCSVSFSFCLSPLSVSICLSLSTHACTHTHTHTHTHTQACTQGENLAASQSSREKAERQD